MADHTLPECKKCPAPLSCCSPEYCHVAILIAKTDWGVELKTTNHPSLPLMGPDGCVCPPHFRPMCTLHNCSINSLGVKLGPNGAAWTNKYFEIREQIDILELEAGKT
jgi:hypothetical protein